MTCKILHYNDKKTIYVYNAMQSCAYLKANVYSFTTLNGCNFELKACMKE